MALWAGLAWLLAPLPIAWAVVFADYLLREAEVRLPVTGAVPGGASFDVMVIAAGVAVYNAAKAYRAGRRRERSAIFDFFGQ